MAESFLKEVYRDYFRIGVACERINGQFTTHEIGNPDKEKLMSSQFSSMTFANELKPAYNMGFSSPEATEEYLPFVINPSAKAMLDWAKENNMPVRGHVMVWHSQCPKECFCKGYKPVTIPTDPEILKERPFMKMFEKLDPVCYVDRDTMLKRLESYIYSLLEYMYKNDYATVVYAWDVVNEAIELNDKTPTGLRNSYWYQVIGDDFIYWAFRFASSAVTELSQKYASHYGIDADDKAALSAIQPKLFYNDYNEWQPEKKATIIGALTRETKEHGSIIGEKLIDGIGMQGHLSDNNDIDEYIVALKEYSELVDEVQITELDVKCTCANKNAEYYQAVFYKKLFENLIEAKKTGTNLTTVTLWGLTDDNSWIRGANPLLFHGDLSPKKSFDALVFSVTGGDLGEPEQIVIDLSDRCYTFENEDGTPSNPDDIGFKMKGFGRIEVQDRVVRTGRYALANEQRFGDWCGITCDISDFLGQTIKINAWVKTPAPEILLRSDIGENGVVIACAPAGTDEWIELETVYKVPSDVHALNLSFGTKEKTNDTSSAVYVDSLEIRLIGLEESFEESTGIAAIRGMGHLPVIYTTDKESRDGQSHSLCVSRQEKDATVKFNISSYIGNKVVIEMYVKTKDSLARIGIDGAVPKMLTEVKLVENTWNKITAEAELKSDMKSAEIYLETDGNSDIFVDDIFVRMA